MTKIVVKPTPEVINRALTYNWQLDTDSSFYMEPHRRAGLLLKDRFHPKIYWGVISFRGRILNDVYYSLFEGGPVYRGRLIKEGLWILGTRRIRFFLHLPKEEKDVHWQIVFLGTSKGTIAIAPVFPPDDGMWSPDVVIPMKEILLKPSSKWLRNLTYSALLGETNER